MTTHPERGGVSSNESLAAPPLGTFSADLRPSYVVEAARGTVEFWRFAEYSLAMVGKVFLQKKSHIVTSSFNGYVVSAATTQFC